MAAVTPGDYCLSGLGGNTNGTTDGWIGVVNPVPAPVFTDLTPQLTAQPLVDPFDCAIDPTNGDIIVVDEGPNGGGTNGSLHRITVTAGATGRSRELAAGSNESRAPAVRALSAPDPQLS